MKEKSIFQYLQDNINANGKVSADCTLKCYLEDIQGNDCNYIADNLYKYAYTTGVMNFKYKSYNINAPVEKVEFRIYYLIEEMLSTLNSNNIEDYLKTNNINLDNTINRMKETIAKNIKKLDKTELYNFCKENILKTQNIYCMYIYLLVASYINFKEHQDLQEIILKIALLNEFTLFVNDFILDKFTYPDYYRYYLAKRIKERDFITDLLYKITNINDDIKYWALVNCTSVSSKSLLPELIKKLDFSQIFKKWALDSKLYLLISKSLYNLLLASKYSDKPNCMDEFEKLFLKYFSVFNNFSTELDIFLCACDIYCKLCDNNSNKFSENVCNNIKQKALRALNTDNALYLIHQQLDNTNINGITQNRLYDAIINLNIKELLLNIYNKYKEDPLENYSLLYLFKNHPDLHQEGLALLDSTINWDEVIGEFSNIESDSSFGSSISYLIVNALEFPNLAMKVYAKTLKAKDLQYRKLTVYYINGLMLVHNIDCVQFSKELKESLDYSLNNEINTHIKSNIKSLAYPDYYGDDELSEDAFVNSFNLVGKNDDKISAKMQTKEKVINLKGNILNMLQSNQSLYGIRILNSNKILYAEQINNNEFLGYCQGDEFGKEFTVKLKCDNEYNLTECFCTCGKSHDDIFCKHVCALLVYLSKQNDTKNKKNT